MQRNLLKRSPAPVIVVMLIGMCVAMPTLAFGPDISVGWIARYPRIDYVWGSTNAAVEGWPSTGEKVTWVAHVRNLSGDALEGVDYRWTIDGQSVEEGEADLAPDSLSTFELDWTWTFDRHEIEFEIDSGNEVDEVEERNNDLVIYTDALGVGFFAEQTFWESIRDILVEARIGATTFDDWMQIQVRRYNEMAHFARFPETPNGVIDRWRIDAIHVVPDGALPLVPPGDEVDVGDAPESLYAVVFPDSSDRTIDMEWGFPARSIQGWQTIADTSKEELAWLLTIGNSQIHELGHARYLVDVYAWSLDEVHDVVEITPGPPTTYGRYHQASEPGLMATQWGMMDRYSAMALNRIAGRRATYGNYNTPQNYGEFLDDLPAENIVRFVTTGGQSFPNTTVRIYKPTGQEQTEYFPYAITIDAVPDLELETDETGAIRLGRNPFYDSGLYIEPYRANVTAVAEVLDGATSRWAFIESLRFNIEYWKGNTELAEHEVVVDPPFCFDSLGPSSVLPRSEALVSGRNVTFEWNGTRGHRYELWTSVDLAAPTMIIVDGPAFVRRPVSVERSFFGKRVNWWIVDHDPSSPCPPDRSSLYAFELDAPPGVRRRPARR